MRRNICLADNQPYQFKFGYYFLMIALIPVELFSLTFFIQLYLLIWTEMCLFFR